MLIEFSVGNFRSFKNVQTLSFVAAPIKSKYPEIDMENVFEASNKQKLLKTVGMYGANGSGKSNLVKAMAFFFNYISFSETKKEINSLYKPFRLNINSISEPSFFQIIFIVGITKYRYGFELLNGKIKSEWLFGVIKKSEVELFKREFEKVKTNNSSFSDGKVIPQSNIPETSLVLNIGAFLTKGLCFELKNYFFNEFIVVGGLNDGFSIHTANMLSDIEAKKTLINLIENADFGIKDILNPHENKAEGANFNENSWMTLRDVFDNDGNIVHQTQFTLNEEESAGTFKFLSLSGLILMALSKRKLLVLDEFDARLHPLLTKKIVQLFNSPKTNPKNAQLFFITHDTNLLDPHLLRRDQIYFAEKNNKGESVIYSLTDFKGVRNDASFEKDYINGIYGAIPFLGGFKKLFEE
ncbi:MAG: AAA family ATPase [Cytophagales bacterium]